MPRGPDQSKTEIEAARRGSTAAWTHLYRAHFASLFRDARYLCRDASAAEELVQEAFALALARLPSFDARGSFQGWIRGFVLNLARRRWRAAERRTRALDEFSRLRCIGGSTDADPHHGLELRRRSDALSVALRELPAGLRETFLLRDVQGLPVDEVAHRLGTSEGNVRVRANRARNKLRFILTEMGAIETARE